MKAITKIFAAMAFALPFVNAEAEDYGFGDMGGVFNVSESGAATYTLPFDLPEGINGMQPSLGLVYNSQRGNGVAGMGVSIYGTSVIMRTAKDIYHDVWARGIQYAGDEDDAYSIDGQRLIQIAQNDYRLETSPNDYFVRVGSKTNMTFKATLQNGNIAYYEYKATASVPYAWYLTKVEDPFGNLITYSYTTDKGYVYLQKVEYGTNNNQSSGLNNIVTFEYESRSDAMPYIVNGNSCSIQSRLKTVTIKTNSTERNKYTLTYSNSDAFSRLTKIEESYGSTKLPPVTLNWSKIPSFSMSESTLGPTAPPTILYINDALKTLKAGDGSELTFDKGINVIGDVNGDGKDDMIFFAAIRVYDYNYSYAYSYSVNNIAFKYLSTVSTTGKTILNFSDYSILPPDVSIEFAKKKIENGTYGIFMQDFDGDGRNDVIIPSKAQSNGKSAVYFYIIGKPNISPINVLQNTNEMPLYTTSDFNNNGKADILYLENKAKDGLYVCGLFEYANSESNSFNSASLKLQNTPEKVFSSDFNGDGMSDLIVLYKTGYTIYWNMGVSKGFPFSDSNKTNGSNLTDAKVVQMGDFNGDGLMDFVINSNCSWFDLYINTGKKSIINNAIFFKVEGYYKMETSNVKYDDKTTFNCNVIDLNNDGKQDLVVNTAKYSSGFKNTYTYWFANSSTPIKIASSKKADDGKEGRFAIGDFDGDGYAELINYGYDCYNSTNANVSSTWHIYRNPSISANTNKVTYISNGPMNTDITISYSTLTNSAVYTKGSDLSYPLVNLQVPLNVVRQTYQQMAYNFYTTNYKYSGLRAHLKGRGLLGFTTIEANNTTTGEKRTTTINSLNTTFYEPSKVTTTITKGDKTATTESIFKVITDSKNDKIHFTYPYTIKETGFYGEITTSIDTFDNKFCLLKQQTKYDNNPNMYRQVKYSSFKNAGGVFRPQTVKTIQKHKDDANEFSSVTTYRYDEKTGAVTKMVENASTTMPVTHEYSYNKFGNLETHIVSASDITPVTTTYSYEVTNRFVDTISSSANNLITVYTYNKLGWMTKKQEGIPNSLLTTSYTHDRLGNLLRINYPDGTKTDYTRSWGNSSYKAYSVTTTTTAQAPVTTWYDNAGREVISSTMGEKGISLTSSTSYNPINGKVSTRSRNIGGISLTDYYTYDNMDQLTKSVTGTGQTTTFSYSKRSVAASQGNGKYLSKSYDPWGNLSSVSHNYCSSASYSHFSCGQPKSIYYSDASYQSYTVATMTYDNRGLQTSLTDVDAGKTSYEYDALGRVTKQTDARGNVTTNTYNASGLLTTQVCGGVTTTYTYDSRLRLTKETAGSQSIAYEYDDKNRLTKKSYSIDGTVLTFSYTYNSNGQMATQTFPDGMIETYTYDANGYLTLITMGGQKVWELKSNTGTQRTVHLGTTPLVLTTSYDFNGLPKSSIMKRGSTTLHSFGYTFDGATGNLKSRTGMQSGTENFTYDAFDRLTTGTSYALNGNIASKTGIGKYTYDANKKHAVTQVANTDTLIQGEASLTYNAFNKVATVVQGTNTLTITYGPDRQRTKTVLVNGSNTTTTLYADNYEQRTTNGITKSYHYVASPDGLAAVYVKSGNTATAYYIETDHLGSIIRAYDYIGNVKFSAAYDAWGNQTVSTNAIGLTRGYTGHEHWNQFGLIDMNGRFYDPLLGRFLSPDPYVQAPDNPQNYNRYAYCLNNPLKYNDPDGEWIAEAVVICAMAYMGGVEANFMTANNPLNPADWNWKSASTYTGIVSGAMNGAGMVGYHITFLPKMDGMLVRGAAMATTNVVLNGVGNKLQGNEFLDNWQGAALSGFINGAISGYMLAQENGTNLWWGNEIKYGRSKWSFFTSELPYAEVKFDIKGCGVVEQNNCVPATFKELNDHFGGEASYSQIASDVKYTADGSSGYRPYLNKHYDYEQIPKTELENIEKIQKIRDAGKVISTYSNLGMSHADNVRKISYYSSGIVRVKLRAGSFNTSSMNSSWSFFLINGLK